MLSRKQVMDSGMESVTGRRKKLKVKISPSNMKANIQIILPTDL